MKLPYINKSWIEMKTVLPDSYNGEELHLHSMPEGRYCAFGYGVEIYVRAKNRAEAKEKARLQTPSWYAKLNWKKVTPWNH